MDMDLFLEPCDQVMTAYNLSESIKELDDAGKIVKALRRCSDSIAEVDDKMQEILEWIREA